MFMSTLEQEWVNPAQSPTDILFVLDRSGSMQNDLDVLWLILIRLSMNCLIMLLTGK